MKLFERLTRRAQENPRRLVLPESLEPRTLQAANRVIGDGIANVTFIGRKEEILAKAFELGLPHIEKASFVDSDDVEYTEKYAELFQKLRAKKGVTIEQAREQVRNGLYLGCLMIKAGDADAMVAGALSPTSHVLRAAFQVLKTKPGISVVSGAFIMLLPENCQFGDQGMLVFADCAVVPDPTAEELAQIAISTARATRDIAGLEPRVAMCSFSTKGSGKGATVPLSAEATKVAQEMAPEFAIDGEMQFDAAVSPTVGQLKFPGSKVAGYANTFIFPLIEAGNIGYKIAQRLGGYDAYGPILQGLNAPINDLSRGCVADEVYSMAIITAALI